GLATYYKDLPCVTDRVLRHDGAKPRTRVLLDQGSIEFVARGHKPERYAIYDEDGLLVFALLLKPDNDRRDVEWTADRRSVTVVGENDSRPLQIDLDHEAGKKVIADKIAPHL